MPNGLEGLASWDVCFARAAWGLVGENSYKGRCCEDFDWQKAVLFARRWPGDGLMWPGDGLVWQGCGLGQLVPILNTIRLGIRAIEWFDCLLESGFRVGFPCKIYQPFLPCISSKFALYTLHIWMVPRP